nr:EOG090X032R [Ilyocryptus agilis]
MAKEKNEQDNVEEVTVAEAAGDQSSAHPALGPCEETPPPSRPPSPLPSPPPLPGKMQSDSNWSIEIVSLSNEPPPGFRPVRKNEDHGETKVAQHEPSSNSWSRNLMNSFRKKKKGLARADEIYRKDHTIPDDSVVNTDDKKQGLGEPLSGLPAGGGNAVVPSGPTSTVELLDGKPKQWRLLSLGSFRRRKTAPALAVSPDSYREPEQEDTRAFEPNEETKAELATPNVITEDENVSFPENLESSNQQPETASYAIGKNESTAEESIKSVPETNSGGVEEPPCDEEMATTSHNANNQTHTEDGKPKQSTLSKFFFKREKGIPVEPQPPPETPADVIADPPLSKSSKLRSSFGLRQRTKSADAGSVASAVATKTEAEKKSKASRSSSLMFGSSFSLKRMFQSEPQAETKKEKNPATVKPPSILGKRSKGPKAPRSKSLHADTHHELLQQVNPDLSRSQKSSLSGLFTSFTRESFMMKRRSKKADIQHSVDTAESSSLSHSSRPADTADENGKQTEHNVRATLGEILGQLRSFPSAEGDQLISILENPHVKILLEAHDTIAGQLHKSQVHPDQHSVNGSGDRPSNDSLPYHQSAYTDWEMPADFSAVRIVGLRKNPGEPLGLTVKTEDGQLVIARILGGGAVDRQGLLHVGDVIGEVNGIPIRSAEQLQVEIARSKEHIQLKILPSIQELGSNGGQCCVRAHFDYDPKKDKLLPCPEIGLAFKKGDILQVVNQSDPNWWQAKKVGWSGPAGLIPSQELEERRKAFVAPEADFVHKIGFCGTRISKKKKKLMYQIKSSVELDKAELLLYEEVTRMPPFRRKTLVLVGSEGIGRRTLKNRLINSDPDRFGTTMPHTSRPMRELEEDGMGYWFVSREEMEHDIRDHQFLEHGEHNGHLYGTKLDSIRAVIRQGKMCVLDCSPHALKILHNSPEFMPYVIFLAAPGMEQLKSIYENARYSSRNLGSFDRNSSIRFSSRRARTLESLTSLYEEEDFKNALEESARMQRTYEKYFDQIVINEDPDQTFRKVVEALEVLSNQHQWVPVSWVY